MNRSIQHQDIYSSTESFVQHIDIALQKGGLVSAHIETFDPVRGRFVVTELRTRGRHGAERSE